MATDKKRGAETIPPTDSPLKHRRVADSAAADSAVSLQDFSVVSGLWGERGVRKFMEDTHLMCPSISAATNGHLPQGLDAALYGIFDGHGGKQTAMFIRDQMTSEISAQINQFAKNDDEATKFSFTDAQVKKIFKKSFSNLDARLSAKLPTCKGDAAAFLARKGRGEMAVVPLSEVHKPWGIAEKERIRKAGGTVESGRVNGILEVSRSFGDLPLKKYGVSVLPTLMKFTVNPDQDEYVLLGCDGFWVSWSATEAMNKAKELITKELRKLLSLGHDPNTMDLKLVCQQLVEFVLVEKKCQDNVSVMILRIVKSAVENKHES